MDEKDDWIEDLRGALDEPRHETLIDGEELGEHFRRELFAPRRADLPPDDTSWIELTDERSHDPVEIDLAREEWFGLERDMLAPPEVPVEPVDDAPLQQAVSDALDPDLSRIADEWGGVDLDPARRSLFARDGVGDGVGDGLGGAPDSAVTRKIHYKSNRRRRYVVLSVGAGILAVVVLLTTMLAVRRETTPVADVVTTFAPVTDPPADSLGGSDVLSDQTLQAFGLLGVGADAAETSSGQVVIDVEAQRPAPKQPHVKQAGALVVELDQESFESGDTACDTIANIDRTRVGTVCDDQFRDDPLDKYLVVWVDVGVNFLTPALENAGLQVSVDLDGDGRIDIPASITSGGVELPTVEDGLDDSPIMARVVGNTILFAVPMSDETIPQWSAATAATNTQLTDVTEWQRWVIERGGEVRLQQVEFGDDVRV